MKIVSQLISAIDWSLERAFGQVVRSGPFAGMRYGVPAHWGPNAPKILGTYEKELHGLVGKLLGLSPSTIIDVGAAEGYYAVGLARSLPESRIVAFEADPVNRELLAELAERNRVRERIEIRGFCTCALLQQALQSAVNPLLIMDVEGYEDELLDPAGSPELASVSILLELHDRPDPALGERIISRFRTTHEIEEIVQTDRQMDDLPFRQPRFIGRIGRRIFLRAMHERREYRMRWLFMRPRSLQPPSEE